jgi:hypothetical protein
LVPLQTDNAANRAIPPPDFGRIQPGEPVELLFPFSPGGALTAEVNAAIPEDRTAAGDEARIASMSRFMEYIAVYSSSFPLIYAAVGQAPWTAGGLRSPVLVGGP